MSDSEEEVIARKRKPIKLLNSDDDESDDNKKSERCSGVVNHSEDSNDSSKSVQSKTQTRDELDKIKTQEVKSGDSPAKSTKCDTSDEESRSRSRKSSTSSHRSRSGSKKSSSSRSRSRSCSSKSSSSSSDRSKSRSRKSSTSSNGSKRRSRKSSSSSSRSRSQSRKSSSSSDRSKARSGKSSSSSDRGTARSRKSSSSSDRSKARSRKSSSSSDRGKARSRKSSSSSDGSRSRSRKSSTSSNESKSRSKKSDTSDKESQSQSQSRKSDGSDDEKQSVHSKTSNKSEHSDNEKSPGPRPTPVALKSNGKFSLITESDLESENEDIGRPISDESCNENDSSLKIKKKTKKLHKKKTSPHTKSNGSSQLADSSESDNEENSSPKHVPKSGTKRKSETKPEKKPKASKKEKDPLLSIRSETQRMIREGRISLPYHQPKQRSLHEFLQRRKAAPSIPLKVTSEELRTVCEHLTIKEKEVEDFYKSESDNSEPETQPNDLPETNTDIVNDTAKEAEPTLTDPVVDSSEKLNELEVETETNSAVVDNQEINESPSTGLEPDQAINSAQVEKIDSQLTENDENLPTKEPTKVAAVKTSTFEEVIANGSNQLPSSRDDQTTPMDVNEVTENSSQDCQNLSNISKAYESTAEKINEQIIRDSVDFELRIDDSCNDYTDEPTKPSNKPESETLPDSVDFDLRLEDSPCEAAENPAPSAEARTNSNEISVDAEPKPKPVISKDRLRNRIEALLSTRNIKLSSINFDLAPEAIQIEIPSYEKSCDEKPRGIHKLKEKFMKHSMAKNKPKSAPSQVNVVTTQTDTEGGITGVTKETLTMGLNEEENEFSDPKLQIPGAKHAYLKKKMLDMLILKKEATWNQYQNEKRRYDGYDSEEENDIDENDDEDASSKKLNFQPYHPEDEPDDDELIEDDVVYEEKTRDKNDFLDEEAEVSDVEADEDENQPDEDDSVDSDGLDFAVKDDAPPTPSKPDGGKGTKKLFERDTTGNELENKLLGFESVSQMGTSQGASTSQIFALCSGTFATQVPLSCNKPAAGDDDEDDFFVDDSLNLEDSQDICLSLPDTDTTLKKPTEASNKETALEPNAGFDSEDEEDEVIVRKKPTMRIVEDSDDETGEPTNEAEDDNEAVEDEEEEEEIAEYEEGILEGDDVEAEEYGYNSEEELVTYEKAEARDFFENEAELSESEWGSEDENEKDLDKFEKEAGDDDDIDTDKLKEELGKIHMRQMLDDDQHDVLMLKEMLLEDGDLHSDEKRQRKFQWKNLTDADDFFKKYTNDSDDENTLNDDDNDESEEHWRKLRHERETFLSQQEKKSIRSETSTECLESTFMKLPTSTKVINECTSAKIVQRVSINSKDKVDADLPSIKSQFKCGSFLSRGKVLLSKMALSVSETKGNINGVKNSRNFLFGARSPEKEKVTVTVEKTEKRKLTSSSTSVSKKLRLSVENGSTKPPPKGLLSQLALLE